MYLVAYSIRLMVTAASLTLQRSSHVPLCNLASCPSLPLFLFVLLHIFLNGLIHLPFVVLLLAFDLHAEASAEPPLAPAPFATQAAQHTQPLQDNVEFAPERSDQNDDTSPKCEVAQGYHQLPDAQLDDSVVALLGSRRLEIDFTQRK